MNFIDTKLIFIKFLLITQCIQEIRTTDDWQEKCGICKCMWSSGKKTATCLNLNITQIPTTLHTTIQVLDLSQNYISEIKRDIFQDAGIENIHRLTLRSNRIEEVKEFAFTGLAVLIELDLSDNLITELKPRTFEALIKVRSIILNNNQIEVLPDLLFNNLTSLSKIEINYNRLRTIGTDTFVRLPLLSEIGLGSNHLSTLHRDSFIELKKLRSLSIINNPLNCTCDLRLFRDFLVDEIKLYTPPTQCAEPLNLKGFELKDVPKNEFACKPTIIRSSSSYPIETFNQNVTLYCDVKAYPAPNVTWSFNARPIESPMAIQSLTKTKTISSDIYKSELSIYNLRTADKGTYACLAFNQAGQTRQEFVLTVSGIVPAGTSTPGTYVTQETNIVLYACIISGILLVILIIITIILCCYCRYTRKYIKNGSISENGLVSSKMNKSQNDSIFEGGSVIKEMQKALLTDVNASNVNPVEKPPRRSSESNNSKNSDLCDAVELKRTLLDESVFGE